MTLLARLLTAWKKTPHPRLADAVDGVTALLLAKEPRPALGASKKQADLDAWAKVEREKDPLDFPRLVVAARGGQQADVVRQVTALARWKDPRFAAGLLGLLERPPYAGIRSRPMLDTIFKHLIASGDARAAEPARSLAARYLGIVSSSTGGLVVTELNEVASQLEALAPAKLSAANEKLCLEVEALAPPAAPKRSAVDQPRLSALIELVYAAPDDDAPRAVLVDALLEAGDARGEFIRTQLAGGTVAPELLKSPAVAAWVQPLQMAGQCTFKRGFPHAVFVYKTAPKSKDERSWRTVREVDELQKLSGKGAAELLNAPHLENVRAVATLTEQQLFALGSKPRAWTSLRLSRFSGLEVETLTPFPQLEALRVSVLGTLPATVFAATPKLMSLDVRAEIFDASTLTPLRNLRALQLTANEPVEALKLPASLERAELSGRFSDVRFETPRLTRLACSTPALQGAVIPSLRALELFVAANDARTLEGVAGVTHLQLSAEKTAVAPKLLTPLQQLISLRSDYSAQLRGAHLESLGALTHLSGFSGELDELPRLPSLVSFECMAPRKLEPLGDFLSKNPQLEYLDLQWNSGCPLYFYAFSPIGKVINAWETLRALVEPTGVRVLRVHDSVSFVRDSKGSWSRAVVRGRDTMREADKVIEAVRPVFPVEAAMITRSMRER